MKRVLSFDEFLKIPHVYEHTHTDIEYFLNKFKNDTGVSLGIIPYNSSLGSVDHIVYYKDANDVELGDIKLKGSEADEIIIIKHPSLLDAEIAYEHHIKFNFFIKRRDDPKERVLGWIVFKGTGLEYHTLSMTRYKIDTNKEVITNGEINE